MPQLQDILWNMKRSRIALPSHTKQSRVISK